MFTEKTAEEIASLTPEELKAYNKAKKEHDAQAKKSADSSSNQGITKEFFDKKGEESQANLLKGGSAVQVNLVNKTLVEFTEDFGFFKKGHRQEVSDVALAIYEGKKVIKKL